MLLPGLHLLRKRKGGEGKCRNEVGKEEWMKLEDGKKRERWRREREKNASRREKEERKVALREGIKKSQRK